MKIIWLPVTYPPADIQTADAFKTVQDLIDLEQYSNQSQPSFQLLVQVYYRVTKSKSLLICNQLMPIQNTPHQHNNNYGNHEVWLQEKKAKPSIQSAHILYFKFDCNIIILWLKKEVSLNYMSKRKANYHFIFFF